MGNKQDADQKSYFNNIKNSKINPFDQSFS